MRQAKITPGFKIHDINDIAKWTKIVEDAFPKYKGNILVFGYGCILEHYGADETETVADIFKRIDEIKLEIKEEVIKNLSNKRTHYRSFNL